MFEKSSVAFEVKAMAIRSTRAMLILSTTALSGMAHSQDRAHSPYFACAADAAKAAKNTNEPIVLVQEHAARECQPLLDRNLDLSAAAMRRANQKSSRPLASVPDATLKNLIRPKLQHAFARIIEIEVPAFRAKR